MHPSLPEALLVRFSQFVESRLGLHLPKGRLVDLERGLSAAAKEMGWADVGGFAYHLLNAPMSQEVEDLLAAHLTIGETYFYRDPRAFEVLEKEVLPEMRHRAGKEKKLRIWSAACCTGEEPYSIAMAVRTVLGEGSGWKVSIRATDLNPRFLRKAAAGLYGPWSFRTLPEKMRTQFFHKRSNDRWQIDDRIKRDVTFTGLNFMEDSFPSVASGIHAMDVIFCRNVLMYFSRETAAKVIAKLRQCLVPGGWLFTSPADAPRDLFAGFAPHDAEGTVIYRRSEETEPARKPVPVASHRPSIVAMHGNKGTKVTKPRVVRSATHTPPPASDTDAGATPACVQRRQARTLADQGQLDEALVAVDLAIKSDKLDPVAHYLRGVILHEKKLENEAIASLQRALYLDPGFVLAHVTLGNLMRRTGKSEAARRCLENARDILSRHDRDAVLPESGGITAGRLLHIISTPQGAAA
jgi:chemotaxis protein methyltransferase CheR